MSALTYKEDDGRFDVGLHEAWQAGDHTVICSDWNSPNAHDLWNRYAPGAKLAYVDPPWNQGNASTFMTKAGRRGDPNPFDYLLLTVLAACQVAPCGYVEMGNATMEKVDDLGTTLGLSFVWQPITYYKTKPCAIGYWSNNGGGPVSMQGLDDEDTPLRAIESHTRPGDLVVDPCAGRGHTATCAHLSGRRATTLELHPRRAAISLQKLAREGLEVRRVQ